MQYCGVVPITCDSTMLFPTSLVTIIYNLWIQPRDKLRRKWTQTPVSVVMKSLSGFMSLWVQALISTSRFLSQICYQSDGRSHWLSFPHPFRWLPPLPSSTCRGLLLGHALIFQLPWVNRDEPAVESKLLTLRIWSSANFAQLKRTHQSCRLWKWQVLGWGGGIIMIFSCKEQFLQETPSPPKQLGVPKRHISRSVRVALSFVFLESDCPSNLH